MGTKHPSVALAAVRDASGEPTWWTTRCERQLAGFRHRLFSLVSRLAVSSTGWGGADGIRQPPHRGLDRVHKLSASVWYRAP